MSQGAGGDKFISVGDMDRLIAAHDGDVALLYLYLLRTGDADTERAARALCRTLGEIDAAEEKLRRMELLPAGEAPQKQPPAEEHREYTAEDIVRRTDEDPGFAATVVEAQKVLGHTLSGTDLKTLFGFYDYLALPPEVILELLNYCVAISPGRRPSMRFIEKQAYAWANLEIVTLAQAEEHIHNSQLRREDTARLAALLGIRGREPGSTERKYLTSWLDMGFDEAATAEALDRTLTHTGKLSWGYMDKILRSWHGKGLHSAAEIEQGDPRRRPAPTQSAAETKQIDMGQLRAIAETLSKK